MNSITILYHRLYLNAMDRYEFGERVDAIILQLDANLANFWIIAGPQSLKTDEIISKRSLIMLISNLLIRQRIWWR